jgi:hypothetical protein
MSKSELKHELKHEIKKVNKTIDEKIVKGLPYYREARQHKLLRARLSILKKTSWLARMKTVSAFMF